MTRLGWVGKTGAIALARQCVLAGVARASVYAQQKAKLRIGAGMQDDEALKRLIDEEYTRHPFFGSRKMVVYLKRCEHNVNRKRVQRLMRSMGLAGMAPGPHTPCVRLVSRHEEVGTDNGGWNITKSRCQSRNEPSCKPSQAKACTQRPRSSMP